jgi:hypothetical protein
MRRWRWCAPLLIALVVAPLAAHNHARLIRTTRYFADENDWAFRTYFFRLAFFDQNFSHPRWGEHDGIDHPHVAEFLIAASFLAHHEPIPAVPAQNQAWMQFTDVPYGDRLAVARLPSAVLGAATAVVVGWIGWVLTARVAGGLFAGLSYAFHPLALECQTRAMSDASVGFFTCMAVLFTAVTLRFGPAVTWGRVAAAAVAAAAAGLAVGSKLTGVVALVTTCGTFAAAITWAYLSGGPRAGRWAALAASACLLAAVTTIVANPSLYTHPVNRFAEMIQHRWAVSRAQQEHWPDLRLDGPASRVEALERYLSWDYPGEAAHPINGLRIPLGICGLAYLALHPTVAARRRSGPPPHLTVLIWTAVLAGLLLPTLPLDWARYFLPFVQCWEVLTACGVVLLFDGACAALAPLLTRGARAPGDRSADSGVDDAVTPQG